MNLIWGMKKVSRQERRIRGRKPKIRRDRQNDLQTKGGLGNWEMTSAHLACINFKDAAGLHTLKLDAYGRSSQRGPRSF